MSEATLQACTHVKRDLRVETGVRDTKERSYEVEDIPCIRL